jgi:hypothetical protein
VRAYQVGVVYNGVDEYDSNYAYDYTYNYYQASSNNVAQAVAQPTNGHGAYTNGYHHNGNDHDVALDEPNHALTKNSLVKS